MKNIKNSAVAEKSLAAHRLLKIKSTEDKSYQISAENCLRKRETRPHFALTYFRPPEMWRKLEPSDFRKISEIRKRLISPCDFSHSLWKNGHPLLSLSCKVFTFDHFFGHRSDFFNNLAIFFSTEWPEDHKNRCLSSSTNIVGLHFHEGVEKIKENDKKKSKIPK